MRSVMARGRAAATTCPACGDLGIGQHSVLIRLDLDRDEPLNRSLATYTFCVLCGEAFRFDTPTTLVRESKALLVRRTAWIVPPWAERGIEADLKLSWDVARACLRDHAEAEALLPLINDLREAGLHAELRADCDDGTLRMTRSRSGRPAPQQRHVHVRVAPRPRGSVEVSCRLAGDVVFGPVAARYDGDLKLVVDALAASELDD